MEEHVKKLQSLLKENNSAAAIALLTEFPELLNESTEKGLSLLLLSAYHRNTEVLDHFAEHKSDLSFFEATATGSVELVREHLQKNEGVVNAFSPDGFTALGLASYFGHETLAKVLLEAGADVNIYSDNGMKVAPLHSAVASKNLKIASLLLSNGADVNARQTLGVTPLHSAAHQGDQKMVELLLSFDADVNAKMENGKKPLDFAKEDNNQEVVALLR